MMWSAVCSEAPHSQFGEGAAPHLYTDEWNGPTPVRRRFSFTQDVLGKPGEIPLCAFTNGTTIKLDGLFSTLSLFVCLLSVEQESCD